MAYPLADDCSRPPCHEVVGMNDAVKQLPVFKGYTVDVRLKQFRKVAAQRIQFLDFASAEGDRLLAQYIDSLDLGTPEGRQALLAIWA